MPLDSYVDSSIQFMNVVSGDDILRYGALQTDDWSGTDLKRLLILEEDFYERSKRKHAIVATGETSLYANIILKKGQLLKEIMFNGNFSCQSLGNFASRLYDHQKCLLVRQQMMGQRRGMPGEYCRV